MLVGFVHGVMNTDNMTISGETIDYGPCAFLDGYDPAAVYSSIDHEARYAYGNQPAVAQWNLIRFAETLLPLIDDDVDAAVARVTEVLETFPQRYRAHLDEGLAAKLGVRGATRPDPALGEDLLALLAAQRVDMTLFFRGLSEAVRGDDAPARDLFTDRSGFDEWAVRWRSVLGSVEADASATAAGMDRVNPVYIPRNHLVEQALTAATAGDMAPFHRLVEVLARPFEARPGLEAYAMPAPEEFGTYTTFCGT